MRYIWLHPHPQYSFLTVCPSTDVLSVAKRRLSLIRIMVSQLGETPAYRQVRSFFRACRAPWVEQASHGSLLPLQTLGMPFSLPFAMHRTAHEL